MWPPDLGDYLTMAAGEAELEDIVAWIRQRIVPS